MDSKIRKTAQEQAYLFLREAILSGKLAGGTRLNISQVATRLDMSRMPVRDALRQLDAEGLVTIRPHRGVIITKLTPEDVLEVFEMRAVLEGLAVRVALPRLDADAFEDLERLLERMARNAGNLTQWLRLHNEFHDYICRKSGWPRLVAQTTLLRRTIEPYLRVHVGFYRSEELLGSEHPKLLEVLREGDPERAERAMRDHVECSAASIADFLKTAGPPLVGDIALMGQVSQPVAHRSLADQG